MVCVKDRHGRIDRPFNGPTPMQSVACAKDGPTDGPRSSILFILIGNPAYQWVVVYVPCSRKSNGGPPYSNAHPYLRYLGKTP